MVVLVVQNVVMHYPLDKSINSGQVLGKPKCAIQTIVDYPYDSVIHHLNK